MNGPPTDVEIRQLEEVLQAVADLRRRVAALESRSIAAASSVAPPVEFASVLPSPGLSSGLLAALGRLLLGIAGAYLLRAITEAALLPQLAGTIAGLLYAGGWLASTGRAAAGGRLNLIIHALTAALIASPLLWEATIRFHSLTPAGAAAGLALFIVLGQVAAWRQDVAVAAGIASLAGSATALALLIATLDPVPFSIAILISAAVIEYGAYRDRALGLRWIIAFAVDFCAFLLIYLVTRPQGLPGGYAPVPISFVIAIPIALAAIYLTSIVARTLRRRLPITWFEIAQATISMALAIVCGLRVARGAGLVAVSAACLAAGVCGYVVALVHRAVPSRNFHAYATFGLLLVSIGSLLVFSPLLLTVLWSMLGLGGIVFGERARANTLSMHGAFYLTAAASVSGLLAYSAATMLGGSRAGWLLPTTPAMLCAAAVGLACGLLWHLRKARTPRWTERLPAAILAALVCWSAVGLAAGILIGAGSDVSLVGTLRTMLIALMAVALAWFGPRWNLRELIWILYPWMIFGALKLFAEDFRQGRPATLFLSLLLYGGTLVVLPRLLRRASTVRPDLS